MEKYENVIWNIRTESAAKAAVVDHQLFYIIEKDFSHFDGVYALHAHIGGGGGKEIDNETECEENVNMMWARMQATRPIRLSVCMCVEYTNTWNGIRRHSNRLSEWKVYSWRLTKIWIWFVPKEYVYGYNIKSKSKKENIVIPVDVGNSNNNNKKQLHHHHHHRNRHKINGNGM